MLGSRGDPGKQDLKWVVELAYSLADSDIDSVAGGDQAVIQHTNEAFRAQWSGHARTVAVSHKEQPIFSCTYQVRDTVLGEPFSILETPLNTFGNTALSL